MRPRQLAEFANGLIQQIALPALDFLASPELSATLMIEIKKTADALAAPQNLARLNRQVNRILAHELVYRSWALPLNSISPRQNRFRELLFAYA